MIHLRLDIEPETEERLQKILDDAEDQETFAQNVIAWQIAELKRGILNLQVDMQAFEEKYQLSSDEFYKRFASGKAGDDEDFMIWAGLHEMLQENEKRLAGLE